MDGWKTKQHILKWVSCLWIQLNLIMSPTSVCVYFNLSKSTKRTWWETTTKTRRRSVCERSSLISSLQHHNITNVKLENDPRVKTRRLSKLLINNSKICWSLFVVCRLSNICVRCNSWMWLSAVYEPSCVRLQKSRAQWRRLQAGDPN